MATEAGIFCYFLLYECVCPPKPGRN